LVLANRLVVIGLDSSVIHHEVPDSTFGSWRLLRNCSQNPT